MGPLFVVALMLATMSIHLAIIIPAAIASQAASTANLSAASMAIYKNALMTWLAANPGYSGTIAADLLTLPMGVTEIAGWTNIAASGTVFVFTSGVPVAGDRVAILNSTMDPTTVGVVTSPGVGTLMSKEMIAVPAAIPVGSTFAWSN